MPNRIPVDPEVMNLCQPYWQQQEKIQAKAKKKTEKLQRVIVSILGASFPRFLDGTYTFSNGYFVRVKPDTPTREMADEKYRKQRGDEVQRGKAEPNVDPGAGTAGSGEGD